MRIYNPDLVDYRFWLIPPDGNRKNVTDLIDNAVMTSTADGIVDAVSIRAKDEKVNGKWIHEDFYLARRILIEAMDGETAWTEVFRGTFNEWQTNAADYTIDVSARDGNSLLLSNDIIYYFSDGSAQGRIKRICADLGLPVGRLEGLSVSLSKELVKSQATTKILEYKDKAEIKTGVKTVVTNNKGKFEVIKRGNNKKIYVLSHEAAEGATDSHSIPSDFVTVVKVYGAEKKKKMPPLRSVTKGNTKFGVHTEIIYSSDYKKLSEANAAAKSILAEKGKPQKKQTIKEHVDIPFLKVGDAVGVLMGTIGTEMKGNPIPVRRYVTAISRDYVNKTMTLELEA